MPAGNIGNRQVVHQPDKILLHFPREEVLIRQNQQDFPLQRRKIRRRHRLLVHQVRQKAGNAHVLLLLVVLENRLEHIPDVGNLLRTFVPDMLHSGLDQRGLQLFIVAVLHVPQHQRRQTVLFLQAFQRPRVHASGGNEHQPADFAGILLYIPLSSSRYCLVIHAHIHNEKNKRNKYNNTQMFVLNFHNY